MTDQAERALRLLLPEAANGRTSAHDVALVGDIFDTLDVGLVSVDSVRDFASVNAAAAEVLGVTPGITSATGFMAVVRDLAARARNRTEASALLDSVERDPSGQFRSNWAFAEAPTLLGVVSKPAPYPKFVGRIWAFYDNSAIASAARAAEEAGALFRASGDAMLDPQVVLEAVLQDGQVVDFRYRDVNAACLKYYGLSREQVIGQSLRDPVMMERYAHCAQTGEPVILDAQRIYSRVLGGERYYDIRAARVQPGVITLTWRDVTERIEAAQRIAASEEQFRLLAENVADVVVRLSDEGWITWISNSVEAALGAPPDYWIGRHALTFATRPGSAERLEEILVKQADIGRALVRGADGVSHWIHLHSKPFYDSTGRRDGVVVSFRVIDDEVATEDRAQQQISQRDERNRSLAGSLQAQTTRLLSQLSSAARYKKSILPADLDGAVAVTARYFPAEELGGDSYDFRYIDEDHLVVYLVDVSGHGVEPALLSVSVHNLLRSGTVGTATLLQPDVMLTELNRLFQMDQHDGHYFTIWYGVYQASTATLRFSSAGHPPALLMAAGGTPDQLAATSIPIGIEQTAEFQVGERIVTSGADIVLYSDGALELGLSGGRQRSIEEFGEVWARTARRPDWNLNEFVAELRGDAPTDPSPDDCTLVRLRIN